MSTNHSLRTTAATRLYEAGIEEQLITNYWSQERVGARIQTTGASRCENTNHRSESVREYKRTREHMKRRVNNIISGSTENTDKAPRHDHDLSRSDIMVTGKMVNQLTFQLILI